MDRIQTNGVMVQDPTKVQHRAIRCKASEVMAFDSPYTRRQTTTEQCSEANTMKITFILMTGYANGGTRVVATHAGKLLEMGHDVRVISRQPPRPSRRQWISARLTGSNLPASLRSQDTYLASLGDRHVCHPHKIPFDAADIPDGDIVIATWWRTAFEAALLPPEKGTGVYFVQGHEVFDTASRDLAHGSYFLPLQKICVSQWLTSKMANLYGDCSAITVPNGVDIGMFNAPARSRNDHPRVGLIYSPMPLKGVEISLKAVEIARRSFPDLELLVFGMQDPHPRLPLPPGTIFYKLPEQNLIPGLYASCDAWLFGSRFEGFGLPILEAMACRTPVVGTTAGAAPELIENGVTGYLVGIDDAEAQAARLIEVLSMPAEAWKSMSDAAHASAQHHSWDIASQNFEAALRQSAGAS